MRHGLVSWCCVLGILLTVGGCQPDSKSASPSPEPAAAQPAARTESRPAARSAYNAANNPTSRAGRGEPSLNEQGRPSAWILIDGQEGQYVEEDGQPQLQWVIDQPVSPTPTFRVEAYEPLLGVPRDFKCVLRSISTRDGTDIVYGLAAAEGTFRTGRDFPLVNPGPQFVIRNGLTQDVVLEIAPLAPGQYLLAGAVRNLQTGAETAAVTYFTVAEGD